MNSMTSLVCRSCGATLQGTDNLLDAAEFEACVQKRLMYQYEKAFQCKEVSDGFLPDRQTMLMYARIDAEEEMERRAGNV